MESDIKLTSTATEDTFRSYLFFWSGQLFSLLGSSITQFALVWWITITTDSAVMLSIASFLYMLPMTIAFPIAGVLVDRYSRKKIIVIADSLQAFVTISIIILFNLGMEDPLLIILMNSLLGLFQGFHIPTVIAIVPTMVPEKKLSRVNGINYLFTGFIHILGPVIGAALLSLFPIKIILWLDPITFIIAFIPLILIKIPKVRTKKPSIKKSSFKKDFKEGFKTLKLIPVVSMMLLLSMFINFLLKPLNTLMPYFVSNTHSGTASDLALISIFFPIGTFIGALITSIKKNWKHIIFIYFSGELLLMVPMIIFALAPHGYFLLMGITYSGYGLLIPILNTIYITLMQKKVPADKMGRVTSIDWTISFAISPIATLFAGFLSDIIGIRNLFFYCAIIGIIITVIIWRFTSVRYNSKRERKYLKKIDENGNLDIK